jgi:hypothetical protein
MKKDNPNSSNLTPSIEDALVPTGRPDPLLEELQVVRLEGRYFCFDRREANRRRGLTLDYEDGRLRIEIHPHFGHPSSLAYKVLQAAFRKVTLEGKPYPDVVSFSVRELGRLVGRDVFGGRDAKDLYLAIRQLEETNIIVATPFPDGKTFLRNKITLVDECAFIAEGDVTNPSRIKALAITLHPKIMNSMRAEHFAIFNWERIATLEPLTAALYKRLYLHLSNLFENAHSRRTLRFEKSYVDICNEWLGGLKPEVYKSRIAYQLRAHFKVLQEIGLIRSVSIEQMADGKNFKLVFNPGAGFFTDYETFYLGSRARVLQFTQAADAANISAPLKLVSDFYAKLNNTESLGTSIFSEKDTNFAKALLAEHGEEGARDLFAYAFEQAPLTKFNMQTIHAVRTFIPKWLAEREAREQLRERAKAEADARREEQLQAEYDDHCDSEIHRYLEACTPEEMAEIKHLADREAENSPVMFKAINQRLAQHRIVRSRCALPTFEAWLANRH